MKKLSLLLAAVVVMLLLYATPALAGISGAIFTTNADGTRVNANTYQHMNDVYLDGGPGPNAPPGAAGLPEGDYYFQVTDPSGRQLLSTDPVAARRFHVNRHGVIDMVYPYLVEGRGRGRSALVDLTHATGIDRDHSGLGAITVQLMPYRRTPNRGGVYKVWVTPVGSFQGDPASVDNPGSFHGFVPSSSKTDNFKVMGRESPQRLVVRKFEDLNANGTRDEGEPEIPWMVDITDPLGAGNSLPTPVDIIAGPGRYVVCETVPDGWRQTALVVDDVPISPSQCVSVDFQGLPGETHEVWFGNLELVDVEAYKFYDCDADGRCDLGDPPLPGIRFVLTGVDCTGSEVCIERVTGEDGFVRFLNLLPGEYRLEEVLPPGGWFATTPAPGPCVLGPGECIAFELGNACTGEADFDTKGYWHNKNGLGEISADDIAYVNGLAPYSGATEYWNSGPFDGAWEPVNPGSYFGGQTAWGEISDFLVSPVSASPERFQLAQQLLAFVFNVRHRLGGTTGAIQLPDGTWMGAEDLIANAVAVWGSGTQGERQAISSLLDALNNSDTICIVHAIPPPVVY